MDNPTTPDVTPETRDNLLETLEANATMAITYLRTIQSALAIDGPLLNPEPKHTKEKLAKMLRQAYDLGATAHEESMTVGTKSWTEAIEVHVEVEEGGFRYRGDANVDSDVIADCISFEDHHMTDEQVDEILNS